MTPADRIARAILENGSMSVVHLATAVKMRRADVRALLEANPDRFVHRGRARASRWDLAGPTRAFDARSFLELHPEWSLEWADEVVRWLVDTDLATSANGNNRMHITEAGAALSRGLSLCEVRWRG